MCGAAQSLVRVRSWLRCRLAVAWLTGSRELGKTRSGEIRVRLIRPALLLLVCLNVTACASWHQAYPKQAVTPRDAVVSEARVRLTLTSGERLVVHAPVVRGDSIVGTAPPSRLDPVNSRPGRPLGAPIDAVVGVEVDGVGWGKMLLGTSSILLAIFIGACVSGASCG